MRYKIIIIKKLFNEFISIMGENYAINVKTSKLFHDRFWLSSANKGFVCGTSLNGVGRKISLIQHLEQEDVTEIFKSLKANGLVK